MVLQLILNKDGNYEYQDARVNKTPVLDTTAFEAYEAGQKTTLAGETDIGSQTKQLMRETPGQYTTTFNEQTGQFETKQKDTTPVTVDIDPDQLINDPEKAAIYAQIMGMANGNQNNTAAAGGQGQMEQTGPIPTGASPTDPSGAGGGNIGTGDVPMPGETGFSAANTQPTRGTQTE